MCDGNFKDKDKCLKQHPAKSRTDMTLHREDFVLDGVRRIRSKHIVTLNK